MEPEEIKALAETMTEEVRRIFKVTPTYGQEEQVTSYIEGCLIGYGWAVKAREEG